MFAISFIPAFRDNYIWLLTTPDKRAAVVDPGDAAPVLACLQREGLTLEAILVTHHHADHQGGVAELVERFQPAVYGPEIESITGLTRPLLGGERIEILGESIEVVAVPGHTRGHLAYYRPDVLFCGDTLFGAGCGRLFEGTPEQMVQAMAWIGSLQPTTQVYCAHEYTAMNLPFAQAVEPGNPEITARIARVADLRQAGRPTVPLTLAEELRTNPFLRYQESAVISAALANGAVDASNAAVFAAIRAWRNIF